jgi:hypothetical protein
MNFIKKLGLAAAVISCIGLGVYACGKPIEKAGNTKKQLAETSDRYQDKIRQEIKEREKRRKDICGWTEGRKWQPAECHYWFDDETVYVTDITGKTLDSDKSLHDRIIGMELAERGDKKTNYKLREILYSCFGEKEGFPYCGDDSATYKGRMTQNDFVMRHSDKELKKCLEL